MKNSRRRSKRNYHRRGGLGASNWGPVLSLLFTVIGICGVIALLVFVGLPKLLPLMGVDFNSPFAPVATPVSTPAPTPTPHPMEFFDATDAQREVVFDGANDYTWFGDPYFHDGVLAISAGRLVNSKAVMQSLFFFDTNTDSTSAQLSDIALQNTHFMFAKFNADWLVYLDANLDGGGMLMAHNRTAGTFPVMIKQIYTGQPEPFLEGNIVVWTERTGSKMDKLFVCDLSSMETVTLHMFNNSIYGQSKPHIANGTIIWAGESENTNTSSIYSINVNGGSISTYSPGTIVHDPQTNGAFTAWLDGPHGLETALYYSARGGSAELVATGVVEFGIADDFVAYSKDQSIYVYMFLTRKTYQVTPERELAQLLGVSDNRIIYMDVTTRERDVVKYIVLPQS